MKKRYFKIVNEKIVADDIHSHDGWLEKTFTDIQEYYDFANRDNLKVVDGDVVMKTDDELKAEAAARIPEATRKEIRDAMEELDLDDELDLIINSEDYEDEWDEATIVHFDDELVLSALDQLQIDLNAVKLKIHEQRLANDPLHL